jgi:hypothetical protein
VRLREVGITTDARRHGASQQRSNNHEWPRALDRRSKVERCARIHCDGLSDRHSHGKQSRSGCGLEQGFTIKEQWTQRTEPRPGHERRAVEGFLAVVE